MIMGINTNSNMEASLQIGPTEKGMVRLFVSNSSIEIPMDFGWQPVGAPAYWFTTRANTKNQIFPIP